MTFPTGLGAPRFDVVIENGFNDATARAFRTHETLVVPVAPVLGEDLHFDEGFRNGCHYYKAPVTGIKRAVSQQEVELKGVKADAERALLNRNGDLIRPIGGPRYFCWQARAN
jgi:hypothetical protein